MTNEKLYEAIGDINDRHIKEAKQVRKAKEPIMLKWGAMAACLCLVAIIANSFINNTNAPAEYKVHIFSSYDEFANVVPDMQIIENLANIDGIDVTIFGTFVDFSIEDSTKVENYAWFDIEAKQGDDYIATIQLKLNDTDSADVYVKNYVLENETEINSEQIFYAYNVDMEYWDSIVEVDENYYNIHCYTTDKQEFLAFLTVLLDGII